MAAERGDAIHGPALIQHCPAAQPAALLHPDPPGIDGRRGRALPARVRGAVPRRGAAVDARLHRADRTGSARAAARTSADRTAGCGRQRGETGTSRATQATTETGCAAAGSPANDSAAHDSAVVGGAVVGGAVVGGAVVGGAVVGGAVGGGGGAALRPGAPGRSEEHTSELQSRVDLVCRLLL